MNSIINRKANFEPTTQTQGLSLLQTVKFNLATQALLRRHCDANKQNWNIYHLVDHVIFNRKQLPNEIIQELSNGNVGIIFTPREVGEHLIIVKKRGKQIQHSPFRVMVSQSEVGNASKDWLWLNIVLHNKLNVCWL